MGQLLAKSKFEVQRRCLHLVTLSTATPLRGAYSWNDQGIEKPVILSEGVRERVEEPPEGWKRAPPSAAPLDLDTCGTHLCLQSRWSFGGPSPAVSTVLGETGNVGRLLRVRMEMNAASHTSHHTAAPSNDGPVKKTRRKWMTSNHEQLEQVSPGVDELQASHQEYEKRLEELKQKAWLTPNEELEEKRLKKLKLQIKDQMANLRRAAS